MLTKPEEPRIPLPKGWQGCVKMTVLHAIALAHYAIVYARAWTTDSIHRELKCFEVWFNQHRAHSALESKTPYEM